MLRRSSVAIAVALLVAVPATLHAQADSLPPRTHVGLAAVSAVSVNASFASIQRGYHGLSIGGTVDFGHLATPRLRLLADVGYLLSFARSEYVQSENTTYRDGFRDLSGTLALALHPNAPTSRFTPYALGGLGVHVLSSSFGSLAIDTRYNTNNFGLLLGGGARLRLGQGRKRALLVEVRQVFSQDVSRTSVHVGIAALVGELAPH
jgi:hypothetical protein